MAGLDAAPSQSGEDGKMLSKFGLRFHCILDLEVLAGLPLAAESRDFPNPSLEKGKLGDRS